MKEERLREAFGFRDGLAQPVIRGLRVDESAGLKQAIRDAGPLYDDRVVAPGEFILGYRNEYDELTYCPNLEGWTGDARHTGGRFGLNGSYLAVRQIEQKVKAFEDFRAVKERQGNLRKADGAAEEWPAAIVEGRRRTLRCRIRRPMRFVFVSMTRMALAVRRARISAG